MPTAVVPYTNKVMALHPALHESLAKLRDWGVHVLYGDEVCRLGGPGQTDRFRGQFPWRRALQAVSNPVIAEQPTRAGSAVLSADRVGGRDRLRRPATVRDVVDALDRRYPRDWAEQWDRVGLVLGDFDTPVDADPLRGRLRARDRRPRRSPTGADLIVAHHPLLLKPVSSIAPDTYKGRIVHRLIRADVALYVAHTNADVANPGVSDALAARLDLTGCGRVPLAGAGRRTAAASAGSASWPRRCRWPSSTALRRPAPAADRRPGSARPATRSG